LLISLDVVTNSAAFRWYSWKRSYSSEAVRLRFAPSPTGFLHFGGLRTAMYNYLFAKKLHGKFVLRIEDTDRKRLIPGAVENFQNILDWLCLTPDEGPFIGGCYGPYVQSERLKLYHTAALELIERKNAYRCFCSPDRLMLMRKEALRLRQAPKYDRNCCYLPEAVVQENLEKKVPFVVRLKLQPSLVTFSDMVFGVCSMNPYESEGDPVLLKSDGYPTYHFANVVDDHAMCISHVLRGEEWLASTTKHLLLYEAFGWKPPRFAHLPLMKALSGGKLSKRDSSARVDQYQNRGYFPLAILNFVCFAGGGFLDARKQGCAYTMKELIDMFDIKLISRHPTKLDFTWLDHYNRDIIRQTNSEDLIPHLRQTVKERYKDHKLFNAEALDDQYLKAILRHVKDRLSNFSELLSDEYEFLWITPEPESYINIGMPGNEAQKILNAVCDALLFGNDSSFTKDNVSHRMENVIKSFNLKKSEFLKFMRLVITGRNRGLPVYEIFEIFGRENSINRLRKATVIFSCDS
uniref:Nondiscriminating glutamyl-tRNA synthetase EARS2, mitochondrial n=1 Tax=Soboliphyme baturini TaxID=241478 RepID=A0A183IMV5_9BILA